MFAILFERVLHIVCLYLLSVCQFSRRKTQNSRRQRSSLLTLHQQLWTLFSSCEPVINILPERHSGRGLRRLMEEQSGSLKIGRHLCVPGGLRNAPGRHRVGRVAPMFLSHSVVSFLNANLFGLVT